MVVITNTLDLDSWSRPLATFAFHTPRIMIRRTKVFVDGSQVTAFGAASLNSKMASTLTLRLDFDAAAAAIARLSDSLTPKSLQHFRKCNAERLAKKIEAPPGRAY